MRRPPGVRPQAADAVRALRAGCTRSRRGGPRRAASPRLRKELAGTRNRLLDLALVEPTPAAKPKRPVLPNAYQATFYDYTNSRAVHADGVLADLEPRGDLVGRAAAPGREEFDHGVGVIRKDPDLGPGLAEGRVQPYRPMPPLIETELPDGRLARVVRSVSFRSPGAAAAIVGVNLLDDTIVRFDEGAPLTAQAHNPICGLPDSGQGRPGRAQDRCGSPSARAGRCSGGSSSSGRPRPRHERVGRRASASSTIGAGASSTARADPEREVRRNGCGPYRDWQNEEGSLQAVGTNVGSGRLCSSPAKTILDTGSDTGNFVGVAIYVQGQEVVLVSEMEAVVQVRERVAAARERDDRRTLRLLRGEQLLRLHPPPPPRVLAPRLRHRDPGQQPDPGVQRPAARGRDELAHQDVRDPPAQDPARQQQRVVASPADASTTSSRATTTASPPPRRPAVPARRRLAPALPGNRDRRRLRRNRPPRGAGLDAWQNWEPLSGYDVVVWYGAHFSHDIAAEPPGSHGHCSGRTKPAELVSGNGRLGATRDAPRVTRLAGPRPPG